MSVWLRQGERWIRLELYERWQRPPVVSPHAGRLRELVREAAGLLPVLPQPQPQQLEKALAAGTHAAAFDESASRARKVCLVVPDATRRGPWQVWVAPCLEWLSTRTPLASQRSVLIATGVHRPEVPAGLSVPPEWSVLANGTGGYASHRLVGRTRAGTPVRLHPVYVDSDLRVLLADLSFHYFAGFGGGRKLVFPGLGEPEGVLANHRLCIGDSGALHHACRSGRLKGNPVHEDLLEAVSLAPPDLLVQLHEAAPGEAPSLTVGDWREVHEAGCTTYLRGHVLEYSHRPTVLIADAGGAPRDATLLQAHKSLQHAAKFLRSGGRLLLVAGLEEGSGSETLERLLGLGIEDLMRRARTAYELHTHMALALRTACARIEVGVWTQGSQESLRAARLQPLASEADALRWLERDGKPQRWGWLSQAEEVLPKLVGRGELEPGADPSGSGGEEAD